MAQYKISSRIDRVLRIQQAGAGVLSRAGWVAVCALVIPALYVSAAAQSLTSTELPPLSAAEILRVLQQPLPVPQQEAEPVSPTQQPTQSVQQPIENTPATVSTEVLTPTARAGIFRYWTGWVPSAPQARATEPGQVQIQTSTGNDRFNGTVVWRLRNEALRPNLWARNGNGFTFAMTNVQGRTLSFETSQGGTFSYGCPDCSFLASDSGVGALTNNTGTGIIFHLSSDGKSVTATCRAVECRVGSAAGTRSLRDSEAMELAVPQQPQPVNPNNPGLTCFSVFGNVKADGTPFTAADCPGGTAVTPSSVLFFSVAR